MKHTANYIVGDIQGCHDELLLLLDKVNFNPTTDKLWIAGDLVARGPKSLDTLRFAYQHRESVQIVLGNHDLHLLAVSLGVKRVKDKDRTAPIFDAPDRDELLQWLRCQPLLAEHPEFVMSHAGIPPCWDLDTARSQARHVESILQSDRFAWLMENMYQNQPDQWQTDLDGLDRIIYTINGLTRMRFVTSDGRLDMDCKLPPQELAESSLMPWFDWPNREPINKGVIFGHWAALQGYQKNGVYGLDTGCVWGGELTLLHWETQKTYTQSALR
ncbi:symmetrical bis(5'-nucleosyl)-tetraphosphatase [Vibrio agarivorans]|uniref:symmetrical bis(5'-nucleosyl)-tetraphosphatase n=1 Tax=Vibrio agarivorans TaxID=153622 RepID=UPI00222E6698|nr:symmetrical bis(5'-nucleosyl)-tetraphosphatase [Vibrio agarivorans]